MKWLKFFLALTSIALAVLTFSVTFYPFFQIGFSNLSEQYPNSKAYIFAVALDNTGMPEDFYIVGMDFTTRSMVIFDVPPTLSIGNENLAYLYIKYGTLETEKRLSKLLNLEFTDYFIFTGKNSSVFLNRLNRRTVQEKRPSEQRTEFEKGYKVYKAISVIEKEEPLNILALFPTFKRLFNTSIDVAKFMRMANFFNKSPKIHMALYPSMNKNGILVTNESDLRNLSIELQNCTLIARPTSLKFTLIKNSNISAKIFTYTTWNEWTKRGLNIRIIPIVCSYTLMGKNVVFELKRGKWEDEEVRKILKEIYPHRNFDFLKLDNFKNLKYYYEVEENSALYRYYNVGKSDFIILIGR